MDATLVLRRDNFSKNCNKPTISLPEPLIGLLETGTAFKPAA